MNSEVRLSLVVECTLKSRHFAPLKRMISTAPGEHAFDKEFGCEIFFLDFESIVSHTRWEGQFSEYITKAITRHEKRLTGVNVRVIIDDTTRQDNVFDAPAVKKRVQVYVYGTLVHTGEKRCFYYVIYLGPISTR